MKETSGHCLCQSWNRPIRDAACRGALKQNERPYRNLLVEQLNIPGQPMNKPLVLGRTKRLVADVGRRGVIVASVNAPFVSDSLERRNL